MGSIERQVVEIGLNDVLFSAQIDKNSGRRRWRLWLTDWLLQGKHFESVSEMSSPLNTLPSMGARPTHSHRKQEMFKFRRHKVTG